MGGAPRLHCCGRDSTAPPTRPCRSWSVHTEPSSPALRKPRVHVRTPTSDWEQGPGTKPEKCSFYHLVENKVCCQEDMCHLSPQANPGRLLRRGRRLKGRLWAGQGAPEPLTKTGGAVLVLPRSPGRGWRCVKAPSQKMESGWERSGGTEGDGRSTQLSPGWYGRTAKHCRQAPCPAGSPLCVCVASCTDCRIQHALHHRPERRGNSWPTLPPGAGTRGRAEKEVKLMQVKERSLHPFLQPPSTGGLWGRKVCVSCC